MILYLLSGHATQGLPWQDRANFQCDSACCWNHCEQASQVSVAFILYGFSVVYQGRYGIPIRKYYMLMSQLLLGQSGIERDVFVEVAS